MTPIDILHSALNTFEKKRKEYGQNYLNIGKVLLALFPGGLPITLSERDINRFHLYKHIAAKMGRYAQNFHKGGHADSMVDITVYSAMLSALDSDATPGVFNNEHHITGATVHSAHNDQHEILLIINGEPVPHVMSKEVAVHLREALHRVIKQVREEE